jgi:hypothetical protein
MDRCGVRATSKADQRKFIREQRREAWIHIRAKGPFRWGTWRREEDRPRRDRIILAACGSLTSGCRGQICVAAAATFAPQLPCLLIIKSDASPNSGPAAGSCAAAAGCLSLMYVRRLLIVVSRSRDSRRRRAADINRTNNADWGVCGERRRRDTFTRAAAAAWITFKCKCGRNVHFQTLTHNFKSRTETFQLYFMPECNLYTGTLPVNDGYFWLCKEHKTDLIKMI